VLFISSLSFAPAKTHAGLCYFETKIIFDFPPPKTLKILLHKIRLFPLFHIYNVEKYVLKM